MVIQIHGIMSFSLEREYTDGQWGGSVAVAFDADGDDISFSPSLETL